MAGVAGVDHPEEQGEAAITLVERGISVSSRVEFVQDDVITVRPSVSEYGDQAVVQVGERVELLWQGPGEQRAMPAEVQNAEHGAFVRWRLRATGPAGTSQRRAAVRARVPIQVEVDLDGLRLRGEVADLSETGMRAVTEGFGILPSAGARFGVVIALEDGAMHVRAEVVRVQPVGSTQWLISMRFVGLPERDQDRLRRRVFQGLREERARAAAD